MNQVDLSRKVAAQDAFQILDVGIGIEDLLKMVKEPGTVDLDRAKDLEGVSLAGGRDLRLRAYPGPGLIEGGVLPEAGFVFEEERRPFVFGFFLRVG